MAKRKKAQEAPVEGRTDAERIDAEIVAAGGLTAVVKETWTDEDLELWKQQALVLSYLRDEADMAYAANKAGYTLGQAQEWFDNNVLEYRVRQQAVLKQVATKVRHSLVKLILDGKTTSAANYRLAMEWLDPQEGGDKRVEELMAFMEKMARAHAKQQQDAAAAAQEHSVEGDEDTPPDFEGMTPEKLLGMEE